MLLLCQLLIRLHKHSGLHVPEGIKEHPNGLQNHPEWALSKQALSRKASNILKEQLGTLDSPAGVGLPKLFLMENLHLKRQFQENISTLQECICWEKFR